MSTIERQKVVRIVFVSIAIVSFAIFLISIIPKLSFSTFDDAYMFLRYAKHWLAGDGFSWNVEDGSVYGVTSVSYLFLVTLLRGLSNLPDRLLLTLTSFVFGMLSLGLLVGIGFKFFKKVRFHWIPLLLIPTMLLSSGFRYHASTGMETTLSIFANSLMIVSVISLSRRRNNASLFLCLVSAYLAFLTRPDMGIYCVLFPALFLIADDTKNWKLGLKYVLVFALVLIGNLFLMKWIFGNYLPLSVFAKSSGYYDGYLGISQWNPAHEMFYMARESLPYLIVLVFFVSKKTTWKVGAIFIPMILSCCYYAQMIQIMGYNARYYYPSLPFVIFVAYIVLNSYLKDGSSFLKKPASLLLRSSIALLLLLLINSTWIENGAVSFWEKAFLDKPEHYRSSYEYKTPATEELPDLGWWNSKFQMDSLLQKMPEEISIVCSEYGYIGARNPEIKIIDPVGLHDEQTAKDGFDENRLFKEKPDFVWFPHPHYSGIIKGIKDHEVFRKAYEYYPEAYDYGVAIWTDSPYYDQIKDVFSKEFSRVYKDYSLSDYRAFDSNKDSNF